MGVGGPAIIYDNKSILFRSHQTGSIPTKGGILGMIMIHPMLQNI